MSCSFVDGAKGVPLFMTPTRLLFSAALLGGDEEVSFETHAVTRA